MNLDFQSFMAISFEDTETSLACKTAANNNIDVLIDVEEFGVCISHSNDATI
ncbi:MAG: hypothetical protein Q8891_09885 [Bacteroidota bacterium]|nr:hypothetical protein [Bacteroidota bacterium]